MICLLPQYRKDEMDFCRKSLAVLAMSTLTVQAFAHYMPNQLELMLGYNNSSHSNNHIHFAPDNSEVDSLHEKDNGNDFVGGLGYAYNILPWFVAYHDKDLTHSALQRVWVGLDLLFMDTTESGDVYVGMDPALNDYHFKLEEETVRLMVNSEVDFNFPLKNVFPFVQASAGGAKIDASYKDTPQNGVVGGGINMGERTNYNFVYSLGGGVKYMVNPHFQVSASYLYTDFGIVKTNQESHGISLLAPIKDHLYTNSAFFNFSYLF